MKVEGEVSMLKRVFRGLVVAMLLVGVAVAGPFEDGNAALESGDYAQAVQWYRLAADQGNVLAQSNLGLMYQSGLGVPQNDTEASKWYRLAADQGNAYAQSNLGFMYHNGQGVPQDYVQASKWYRLAADQGNAYAQGGLGVMYAKGEGVPQDYVLAHMWLNLAAAQGQAEAVKNRDLAASKMTRDQLAEAQRLARDWKPSR